LTLLLDTQAALWWLSDDDRMGEEAARRLTAGADDVLLSAAVVWEIAVKRSLEKLDAPGAYLSLLLDGGARALPITLEHAGAVERLPWHHRDPFDRMLVAQAQVERATLVSGDPALAAYGVPVVW
jgi:PIN domain nuclease of toxin-antitoxin system